MRDLENEHRDLTGGMEKELQKLRQEAIETSNKYDTLKREHDLLASDEDEIDVLKAEVKRLETELAAVKATISG